MLHRRGIKNEGNFCFLNALMNSLSKCLDLKETSLCEFQNYLFSTLRYINECDDVKNLYLFWVELRRRQPLLFQEQPEKQQPQDAYETLLYLLQEGDLLDRCTIFTAISYCQIKEQRNAIHLHKDWAFEILYYVWENKLNYENIDQLLDLDDDYQLYMYKIVPNTSYRLEWHKDEQLDFDTFTYHIELEPLQSEGMIKVVLQYVENDITQTLLRQRTLFCNQLVMKQSELYTEMRQLLSYTQVRFDLYCQEGFIEENNREWNYTSPIYLVFRTADYEQFVWCKSLDTPKQAINYQYQFQNDQPLVVDNVDQTVILVLQRVELVKNNNPYFIRQNLIINKKTFQLRSICCHLGEAQSGHYISYVKSGNQWEMWDDENVELKNIDYQCMSSAYILFYQIV